MVDNRLGSRRDREFGITSQVSITKTSGQKMPHNCDVYVTFHIGSVYVHYIDIKVAQSRNPSGWFLHWDL